MGEVGARGTSFRPARPRVNGGLIERDMEIVTNTEKADHVCPCCLLPRRKPTNSSFCHRRFSAHVYDRLHAR